MSKLADAFKELCAVCRTRADLAAGGIEDAARRLWRVLGEYPEPIALTALDLWPRRSEWFPTEKELRDLCEQLVSEASKEAASRGSVGGGKFRHPVGNTVAFVNDVTRIRGADYVKSWLAGGVTCLFSANRIYTTRIGVERLHRDFGAMADALGITIEHSDECSRMLSEYCAQNGLSQEPKRRRA